MDVTRMSVKISWAAPWARLARIAVRTQVPHACIAHRTAHMNDDDYLN